MVKRGYFLLLEVLFLNSHVSVPLRRIATVIAALNVRTDHKLSSLSGLMIYCKVVFPRPLGGVSSRSLVGGSI